MIQLARLVSPFNLRKYEAVKKRTMKISTNGAINAAELIFLGFVPNSSSASAVIVINDK
jgi:hypothetical protein